MLTRIPTTRCYVSVAKLETHAARLDTWRGRSVRVQLVDTAVARNTNGTRGASPDGPQRSDRLGRAFVVAICESRCREDSSWARLDRLARWDRTFSTQRRRSHATISAPSRDRAGSVGALRVQSARARRFPSHALRRRRAMPSPSSPVPTSAHVPGSGTTATLTS